MKERTFGSEIWLPRPVEVLFSFFAEAENLQAITPPWLNFVIVTACPIQMRIGTVIDYRLKLHGFPPPLAERKYRLGSAAPLCG